MSDPVLRVLLIEDEKDIRRFVRMALQADGLEVHEADTFQRGLIDAGTRRPDLIVLDLGLPDDSLNCAWAIPDAAYCRAVTHLRP
jgi:two-component system KDP operon response regulator KdpE